MLRKIKSKQDAKKMWHEFHTTYQSSFENKGITSSQQKFYSADNKSVTEPFRTHLKRTYTLFSSETETKLTAPNIRATKIQRKWKQLRNNDTLILVNPKANHDGKFIQFTNINKNNRMIQKSLNKLKADHLHAALTRGDWHHEIFRDALLPQLAMSLFAANKITQSQFSTLLERQQITQDYQITKTFKLLDNQGHFTKEAKKIFIPAIKKSHHLRNLTNDQIEDLRLLISELPVSEQIGYIVTNLKGPNPNKKDRFVDRLVRLDAIYRYNPDNLPLHQITQLVQPSSGVRDAIGLARFGLENYVRPVARLGEQSVVDIENGIEKKVRIQAIQYPETKAFDDKVHNWENVAPFEASAHDVYHSNLMSTIPKPFLKALKHLIATTRQKTGHQWSKEIWDWVDSDYNYFFHHHKKINPISSKNTPSMTNLFFQMLNYGNGSTPKLISAGGSLMRKNRPTPLGILAFIDMIENAKTWKEFEIDPEQLARFRGHSHWYNGYCNALAIYEKIENDPPTLQVLKFHIYQQLKAQSSTSDFTRLNDLINANKEHILQRLSFNKITKKDPIFPKFVPEWANTIHFTVDKIALTHYGLLVVLLAYAYQNKYPNANTESQEFKHYVFAYHELHYSLDEAMYYSELRTQGESDQEARFATKPTLETWVQVNPLKTYLFSLTLIGLPIILLYGYLQTRLEQTRSAKTIESVAKIINPPELFPISSKGNEKEVTLSPETPDIITQSSHTSSSLFPLKPSLSTLEVKLTKNDKDVTPKKGLQK